MSWLAVGSPYQAGGQLFHGQDFPEGRDAAGECKHGRLSGDLTEPCGCWPQEGLVVERLLKEAA